MNRRALAATTIRVLTQLRRDRRTLALLLGVPVALIALVHSVFDKRPMVFQQVGVPLVGLFPLMSMFIVTSITMLRERTSGTLERLMTLPMAKLDLLVGYALGFGLFAAIQTLVVSAVAFGILDLQTQSALPLVIALAVLNALHGMAFGLFLSAFARSEFQAVQFLPAFLLPQLLLSGLLGPREQMAGALEVCSDFLPMTYAYDALERASASSSLDSRLALDVVVVVGSTLLALAVGAATLRRRTA